MSLLIAVETRDLACVLCVPSPPLGSDPRRIDYGGRGSRVFFGFPRILLGFIVLLFFVFSGLIGRLRILSGSGHGSLSLGFIPASHRPLCLDFVRGGVSGSTSSEDLGISFSHVKTRS